MLYEAGSMSIYTDQSVSTKSFCESLKVFQSTRQWSCLNSQETFMRLNLEYLKICSNQYVALHFLIHLLFPRNYCCTVCLTEILS